MNQVILLLLTFLSVTTSLNLKRASLTQLPEGLPLLQAYATKSGTVPLRYNSATGFKVQVDLDDYQSHASDSDHGGATIDMGIALYTSQTIFAESCGKFDPLGCKYYPHCTEFPGEPISKILPYFSATGYKAATTAYLDYNYWSLSYKAGMIVTSCITNNTDYGYYQAGLIGLGVADASNFLSSKIFSIYISKDGRNGTLLFRNDPDYIDSSVAPVTLPATTEWYITGLTRLNFGEKYWYGLPAGSSVLFDVNVDIIGVPLSLYENIIDSLGNLYQVSCPGYGPNKPTCVYSGSVSDLPTPAIVVNNDHKIVIPPELYVQNFDVKYQSITFNLRALSNTLSGSSYVVPECNGCFILGSPFMHYYYTVFDGNSNNIAIYKAKATPTPGPSPNPDPPSKTWIYIIIAVVSAIVVALVIWYGSVLLKKRRAQEAQSNVDVYTNNVAG